MDTAVGPKINPRPNEDKPITRYASNKHDPPRLVSTTRVRPTVIKPETENTHNNMIQCAVQQTRRAIVNMCVDYQKTVDTAASATKIVAERVEAIRTLQERRERANQREREKEREKANT